MSAVMATPPLPMWIHTGDRFVERDGYYYFRGRTDELVKISGQWVWPLEVERCLNEHPVVRECAVLAHELPGRRMTARAVVRLGDCVEESDATRTLLQQFVKDRLSAIRVDALAFGPPAFGGHEVRPPRYAVTPAVDAGVGLDPHDGLVEHRHHPVVGDGRGLDRNVDLVNADFRDLHAGIPVRTTEAPYEDIANRRVSARHPAREAQALSRPD